MTQEDKDRLTELREKDELTPAEQTELDRLVGTEKAEQGDDSEQSETPAQPK